MAAAGAGCQPQGGGAHEGHHAAAAAGGTERPSLGRGGGGRGVWGLVRMRPVWCMCVMQDPTHALTNATAKFSKSMWAGRNFRNILPLYTDGCCHAFRLLVACIRITNSMPPGLYTVCVCACVCGCCYAFITNSMHFLMYFVVKLLFYSHSRSIRIA